MNTFLQVRPRRVYSRLGQLALVYKNSTLLGVGIFVNWEQLLCPRRWSYRWVHYYARRVVEVVGHRVSSVSQLGKTDVLGPVRVNHGKDARSLTVF